MHHVYIYIMYTYISCIHVCECMCVYGCMSGMVVLRLLTCDSMFNVTTHSM